MEFEDIVEKGLRAIGGVLLALLILGCVGCCAWLLVVLYLWLRLCFGVFSLF